MAARDPRIVAITAAMPGGTGLDIMARRFPARVFDVGIAEQHGVTFAAGLAASGMRPFCAIYSSFLQRGYDQIVHDVALQNLPVRFAIDRAGLVGQDGATHAGAFDIGFLASLPNMTVMAAGDEADLVHMMATAAAHDQGPIAFRYPRGEGLGVELPAGDEVLEIGKGRVMREGEGLAILSFGAHLSEALAAADLLAEEGMNDHRGRRPLCQAAGHRADRPADGGSWRAGDGGAGRLGRVRGAGAALSGRLGRAGPGTHGAHADAAGPLHRPGEPRRDVCRSRSARRRHRRDAARIVRETETNCRVNGPSATDLTLAFRLTQGHLLAGTVRGSARMWDFSISKALGLMVRTAPFILLRVLVYFGISAALVMITGTGAGIGYGIGQIGRR